MGAFQLGWWGLGPAMTRPRTHQLYHSGEKLLLSLARIILKRPKVLLMDMGEACRRPTSSSSTPTSPPLFATARQYWPLTIVNELIEALRAVSTATDALINKMIRSKFSTSTVLMFARRPLTAIDYVSFVASFHGVRMTMFRL